LGVIVAHIHLDIEIGPHIGEEQGAGGVIYAVEAHHQAAFFPMWRREESSL
jgi:hypothetical protein